jgi:hypothetical protein
MATRHRVDCPSRSARSAAGPIVTGCIGRPRGVLQAAGDEAVRGLARIKRPAAALSVELGTLKGELLQASALGVVGLALIDGGSGRVAPGRGRRPQGTRGSRRDRTAAPRAIGRAGGSLHLEGALAQIRVRPAVLARVLDHHLAPALPAAHEPLQRR